MQSALKAPVHTFAVVVYPASKGMGHGIDICKSVTQQLMVKQP